MVAALLVALPPLPPLLLTRLPEVAVAGVEGVPPPPRGFPVISLWIFSLEERMSLQACMHRHRLKPLHPQTAEHGQSWRADSAA